MTTQQLVAVPHSDGSGRWSVFDMVAERYVHGMINVSEQLARGFVTNNPAQAQPSAPPAPPAPPAHERRRRVADPIGDPDL